MEILYQDQNESKKWFGGKTVASFLNMNLFFAYFKKLLLDCSCGMPVCVTQMLWWQVCVMGSLVVLRVQVAQKSVQKTIKTIRVHSHDVWRTQRNVK